MTRVRALVAAAFALVPGLAAAQPYPDLGHAFYARGYTKTVWVDRFLPSGQSVLAHNALSPDIPIDPVKGYYDRYGMTITGSGTVTNNSGKAAASGTATNANPGTADGSILVDLCQGPCIPPAHVDQAVVLFSCPPNSTCAWSASFLANFASGMTVNVYRHIQGSLVGERHIDLNGACKGTLISYFGLPAGYSFTGADDADAQYVADKTFPDRSITDQLLLPLCSGAQAGPVANFSWSPSPVYPNTTVTFNDSSSGFPNQFTWSFQGGSPSGASVANPQVTFATLGDKTVTLTARNNAGSSVSTKTVTVLDPNPAGTLASSVSSATQCQPVVFTANATGAPTLTYNWSVVDPSGFPVQGPASGGTSYTWTSQPGNPAGTYTGRVQVSNQLGSTLLTKNVQLNALPTLTDISGSAPIVSTTFLSNTFQLSAPAYQGATQVVWIYGDGTSDTFTDPSAGAVVTHTYSNTGTYNAKVVISNCVNTAGSTSQTAPVTVGGTGNLNASFIANDVSCQFGQCSVGVGQSLSFLDSSSGASLWDYDWAHNAPSALSCNFTDNNHTAPVGSHTFSTAGTYYPCLRVRNNSGGQSVMVHAAIVVGGTTTQTPKITLSGATTGTVNVSQTISAAASNCTPTSNGWSWSTSGGTIGGSATGSSIAVAWSTSGAKTVTATNGGCSGASGSLVVNVGGAAPNAPQAQFVYTPSAPKVGDVVTFDASSSTNVTSGSTYTWDFGFGLVNGGQTILHAFPSDGTYSVKLVITPPGCGSASCTGSITRAVYVAQANAPVFITSPASPRATEDVIFDGRVSPNVVYGSLFGWSFGDGSPSAFGDVVAHTFSAPGTYTVQLQISPPGCTGNCYALASRSVVVGPAPPVSARFTVDLACGYTLGVDTCQAKTAKAATLTATDPGAATYSWSFGDGSTGSGRQVSHTWQAPGTYPVTLATSLGTASSITSKSFVVKGAPPPKYKTVVLPSAFTTSTSPVQTSDLYLYNPSSGTLVVSFEFRRRGTAEANPPHFATTLPPGAVYYTPDMLRNGFHLTDASGFLTVTAQSETIEPLVTAFNTRSATAGKLFGLAFSAASVPASSSSASTSSPPQHLVGLADDSERQATFGLSNPSEQASTYRLRFFDKDGRFLRETVDSSLAAYSQRVFGLDEIRNTLGVANLTDYRVEVESSAGARPFPFATDLRIASGDPSLILPTTTGSSRVYLLGVGNGPGAKKTVSLTDLVLANVGGVSVQSTIALTKVTTKAATTSNPSTVSVPAGASLRLPDVLAKQLGSKSGFGVLSVTSTGAAGQYPAVFAEAYDNTNPKLRFGERIVPLTDADAAAAGQKVILVGLRQDYQNRTTLWLFNPGGAPATCTVVYRSHTGTVVGTKSLTFAAGQARQLGPTDHPLGKTGVPNGFIVEVQVTSGKLLAAGQVASLPTNDLAFVRGTVR